MESVLLRRASPRLFMFLFTGTLWACFVRLIIHADTQTGSRCVLFRGLYQELVGRKHVFSWKKKKRNVPHCVCDRLPSDVMCSSSSELNRTEQNWTELSRTEQNTSRLLHVKPQNAAASFVSFFFTKNSKKQNVSMILETEIIMNSHNKIIHLFKSESDTHTHTHTHSHHRWEVNQHNPRHHFRQNWLF